MNAIPSKTPRRFELHPAVRERVPLLFGIVGPSGGGKTLSALRVAVGMQRVNGGKIGFVDTEAERALHYAPKKGEKADPLRFTFDFLHAPFAPPFHPLDYLAAIEHCLANGCNVVIVDSMSHEHEGEGGVLDGHEKLNAEGIKDPTAWHRAKAPRTRMIGAVVQMGSRASFIFCFRAAEKKKWKTGEEPKDLGFQPIGAAAFVYEMTARCLLQPMANGVPDWMPEVAGQRPLIKLPEQFKSIFSKPRALDEEHGEAMARWAVGSGESAPPQPQAQPRPVAVPSESGVGSALHGRPSRQWRGTITSLIERSNSKTKAPWWLVKGEGDGGPFECATEDDIVAQATHGYIGTGVEVLCAIEETGRLPKLISVEAIEP